jgi:osmotically-inducible protein OsmY
MKTEAQLKDDVIEELGWDPQISDADAIGVGVKDGAVILSGHVPSSTVEHGWVTLEGNVDHDHQRREVEADAVRIRVEVSDHTARLYGQVHSLQEANAAQAAASAPGVASVESHLVIAP